MSRQLQPLVSLVKTETPTVIKNEPPESEIVEITIDDILDSSESEEEIIPDVKDIHIVYHPICEHSIKSEILESKHCNSVETLVKAENSTFIKTDNTTQKNKTEGTRDKNVSKGTDQDMVEVQGSNKHSNVLNNLETDKQHVLNFLEDFNGISIRSRKAKQPEKTNFANCYKTVETTSLEKDKEKVRPIEASVIIVKPHEYTSLAKNKHVCNHCQHAWTNLRNLKRHIRKMHREVTTRYQYYQCPYCPYKSKWRLKRHIIQKHEDTKDIQWFQCHLCEEKFKLKSYLTDHMKGHLKHKQMPDGLDLRYHCTNCDYKANHHMTLNRHKLNHLKPEEIQYFYCYHCSYKSKHKMDLKKHIFKHFKKVEFKQGKRHHCDKCDCITDTSTNLKRHKLTHLKPEEVQYFYCYHCSYKANEKGSLKVHIFRHFKKGEVNFDCYICNFMTPKRESIIEHIKKHSKVQIKFEINEGS